eukprot:CAMPEP_0168749014 /NCGR_PEP_ID=MMETSP0724-20121128/16483_1 /TAXON_ID=265536 /ORGANISM="Amphiprora sp., Strain CCMP467" /LENGTH=408 /DNA_ID=CAMNT_0008796881 /DNA_START=81 /DNA_END=1308 /DNA_ORIENTATION=-
MNLKAAQNVVLSPSSEDQSAFDSLKVGSPRVHRYSREEDPDGGTEYIMWYHGRSKTQEEEMDNKLPPLTSGRIGRATSRNGLVWEKDTKGSASEDMVGVSLGLNTEEWWGFDTTHVGLGSVLLPMTTPAVLNEGGIYIMYFMGGNHEEQKVADLVNAELPEQMKERTIKGIGMKIGVAVSQDGVTFGRVEGDDPSGACIAPHNSKDPNAEKVPRGFPEEIYCAWPDVVVNPQGRKSEGFMMYYSTIPKTPKKNASSERAISEDGFRWFKSDVVLRPDEEGFDAEGCARCCIIRNAEYDRASGKWEFTRGWTMYYDGASSEDKKHRIMQAESRDGKKWNKIGVVMDVGDVDSWDHKGVSSAHVIRLDDGTMRMYYQGEDESGNVKIGVSRLSDSGVWEREETAAFSLAG